MVANVYFRNQNCLFVHCKGDLKIFFFNEDVLFYTGVPSWRMTCDNALAHEAE